MLGVTLWTIQCLIPQDSAERGFALSYRCLIGRSLSHKSILPSNEGTGSASMLPAEKGWLCRRKGMSSEVTVSQYFDDQMLLELARQDADLQGLF